MLIRFTVENFRSFAAETTFSMLPGRAQKHADHVLPTPAANVAALRAAIIYGANASGKSNLVRAITFARRFVVDGLRPKQRVPVEPFRLGVESESRPSRFEFEFVAGGQVYAYGFVVDSRRVQDEWLYVIRSAQSEYALFERVTDEKGATQITFGKTVTSDADSRFFDFVARTVRPNQLLLTKMAENNVELFESPYEWFRATLAIIFPDSFAHSIQLRVHKDQRFSQALAAFLQDMNTGITEVCTTAVELDSIDFPLDLIEEELSAPEQIVEENNGNDMVERMLVLNGPDGRYLLHRDKKSGALQAYVLHTRHHAAGKPVDFQLTEESDGTQRLFDLFPVLYSAENRVFVIDELERSLHPNLVRHFIRQFLRSGNRNQLIVTTHESTLLDLSLLRRDEIWFVEKAPDGASTMYSLEAFKPRHDLDIRKGYLQGRFGAIPVFGSQLLGSNEEL